MMKLKKPLFDIFITASTLVTLLVSGTGVLLPQSVESVAHFSWTNIQTSSTRGSYYFLSLSSHHQCICICTFPNNQIFRQRNLTILLIVKWHTQIYEYRGISDQQSIMIIIFIIIITWYNKRNVCFVDRISSSRTKHISNSFIYRSFLCSKVGSKHAKQIGYIQIFSLLILYYYHDGHFFVELMSYVIKR